MRPLSSVDIVIIAFVFFLMIFIVVAFKNIKNEEAQCYKSPLIYSAKVFSQSTHEQITCSCYNRQGRSIHANSTNQWEE